MALYQIRTTRQQEAGLTFAYNTYADKTEFPTQLAYFQSRIDHSVTNPMEADRIRASSVAFDQSFDTIPDAEQAQAQAEIEAVIVAHGGTVVPPGTTLPPPPGQSK